MSTTIDIPTICGIWRDQASRPLFSDRLIDDDGCCCAQGDVLRRTGIIDAELLAMEQATADLATARALGISRAHSVLLRQINDKPDGCPQDVLEHPERIIGDQAARVLTFWQCIDVFTPSDWINLVGAWNAALLANRRAMARATTMDASRAAGRMTAARAAARHAATIAAGSAAMDFAGDAAGTAAWDASGGASGIATWATARATNEIQGAVVMRERNLPLCFLPMFRFNGFGDGKD